MNKRKTTRKPTKYSIAIICEGHTEWHYFDNMKQVERFPFAIKPSLPQNTDVQGLIKQARDRRDAGYDKVCVVMDMDTILSNEKIKTLCLSSLCRVLNYGFSFISYKPIQAGHIKPFQNCCRSSLNT